jgi:hypothetical protein
MPICIFTDSQNDPNANPWLIFGNGLLWPRFQRKAGWITLHWRLSTNFIRHSFSGSHPDSNDIHPSQWNRGCHTCKILRNVEYLRIRKSNLIGQFGTQIIVKKTILSLATISVRFGDFLKARRILDEKARSFKNETDRRERKSTEHQLQTQRSGESGRGRTSEWRSEAEERTGLPLPSVPFATWRPHASGALSIVYWCHFLNDILNRSSHLDFTFRNDESLRKSESIETFWKWAVWNRRSMPSWI